MDCPHIPITGLGAFSRRMHDRVIRERIPLSGSIELTWRCNLRCQHCYLDEVHEQVGGPEELSTGEICNIFDQVVDEGTLWMLITGGEPLMRRDFADIYRHAKKKGLVIHLFTNGTLITDRIADLLAEWRPFTIEITLYGRTQETYERISGVPGSHARCMAGIERLLERKLPLTLKTMLMTLNQHELWDMQAYAKSLGVKFRFDSMLMSGLTGSSQPVNLRLPAEEAVRFDVEDPERLEQWEVFRQQYETTRLDVSQLYVCEAGLGTFHIDPFGQLSMCMLARSPAYDLRQGSFRQGWREFLASERRQPAPVGKCDQCELMALCRHCPGWAQLENSKPRQPIEYLCRLADVRANAIGFVGQEPFRQPVEIDQGTAL
jgi:radical SAM protein with 4Fe4S-binding SPASM domain